MPEKIKSQKMINIIMVVILGLLLINFGGCKNKEKLFTVGIGIHASVHLPVFEGFKEGMAESGYVEGKNIRYIYDGILGSDQAVVDAEIKKLLSQNVDLLLTTGNHVSLRAKKAVEGTDIPIIIGASSNPVEEGLVESLTHPNGNVTGIRVADTMPKLMELLVLINPNTKKIYLPYNPDDKNSAAFLESLNKAASQLGVKLVSQEVHSAEEAVAAIESLPKDIGAIFIIPSPTLDASNSKLSQAAIKRGLPMGSALPLDESVLLTLTTDFFETGKQAARLADQIRRGIKPKELPMVNAETILTVNLKTAEKIGIKIPDEILIKANKIIR
jgi:putative ABC transport system substrate-binding protein